MFLPFSPFFLDMMNYLKRLQQRYLTYDNFPIYLVQQGVQCGPVCLKMIAQYYGQTVALTKLEQLTNMHPTEGTSLLDLSEAATDLGLDNLGVRFSFHQLERKAPLPALIHWNNSWFIVVYKIRRDKVWIAHPFYGKIVCSKEEFCDYWYTDAYPNEGYALLFEPNKNFKRN